MGAVLLKIDNSAKARNSEAQEKDRIKCGFDKYLEEMILQKIYFISKSTVSLLENSKDSFVGQSDAVRWSIRNFRKYLLGGENSQYCQISVE